MITDRTLLAVEKLQRIESELTNAQARTKQLQQEYERYVAELQQGTETVDEEGNPVSAEPVSAGLEELEVDGAFEWSKHKKAAPQKAAPQKAAPQKAAPQKAAQ